MTGLLKHCSTTLSSVSWHGVWYHGVMGHRKAQSQVVGLSISLHNIGRLLISCSHALGRILLINHLVSNGSIVVSLLGLNGLTNNSGDVVAGLLVLHHVEWHLNILTNLLGFGRALLQGDALLFHGTVGGVVENWMDRGDTTVDQGHYWSQGRHNIGVTTESGTGRPHNSDDREQEHRYQHRQHCGRTGFRFERASTDSTRDPH